MKNLKFFYLFAFLSLGLLFAGCSDDDEDTTNKITIVIEEPINDETIARADCGEVHVHVDFAASVENHEVEIILHPEGDTSNKIIDYDEHDHDKEITFEQEVSLCDFDPGTCFHLEVFACVDHDCTEKASAEAEFCIN